VSVSRSLDRTLCCQLQDQAVLCSPVTSCHLYYSLVSQPYEIISAMNIQIAVLWDLRRIWRYRRLRRTCRLLLQAKRVREACGSSLVLRCQSALCVLLAK
jgi:hypothetical protein